MPLVTRLGLQIEATQTATAGITGTAPPAVLLQLARVLDMASGVAAGQADLLYQKTRSTSGNDDLDLNGVLLNDFGLAMAALRVKALYIAANVGNVGNVLVGAAAANPWVTLLNTTGILTLRPGADILVRAGKADATGYGVTAGTGDILRVASSGGSVTYDIAVFGTSA